MDLEPESGAFAAREEVDERFLKTVEAWKKEEHNEKWILEVFQGGLLPHEIRWLRARLKKG